MSWINWFTDPYSNPDRFWGWFRGGQKSNREKLKEFVMENPDEVAIPVVGVVASILTYHGLKSAGDAIGRVLGKHYAQKHIDQKEDE